MKYYLLYLIFLFGSIISYAQSAKILAGPMNGYSEHRECLVWVQTQCAKKIVLSYISETDQKDKGELTESINNNNCEPVITKFVASNLKPGASYKYKITLDGKEIKTDYTCRFQTRELWEWRSPAPNFSFLVGSCNYINDSVFDRPGEPYGQSTKIYQSMAENSSKTMIWLGDNVYLREADYSSVSGIQYRYQHTRKQKDLQRLLATKHHYAIWDDHDFGPNNSCKTFDLKSTTQQLHKDYWGNKYYGQDGKGVYSKMQISDCEFFMLDNRYFRDEDNLIDSLYIGKSQLGKEQLDWFLQSLLSSRASFKFVVMGGQFLNFNTDQESYQQFERERKYILNFLSTYKIGGVIFISGDRHHTEVLKYQPTSSADTIANKTSITKEKTRRKERKKDKKGNDEKTAEESEDLEEPPSKPEVPTLYELTCSPLTSKGSNVLKTTEANNPQRIKQTLITEPNFCQLSISGKQGNRSVLIRCYDAKSELKWEFTIRQEELKW